jgi:hypothetical protein
VIARLARSAVARYVSGVDLSKALGLPWWMEAAVSHDYVAYPLHAGLAYAFTLVEAPPELSGMEWLKAASHARSERALGRVVSGIAASRQRASSSDFDGRVAVALVNRVTCTGSDVTMRQRQLRALHRAGLSIPDAQTRRGAGGAPFNCLIHPDGGCPPADAAGSRPDGPTA